MRSIRCGRGLGDSIYLQSVVRHLVRTGERLLVHSDYPAVFLPLAGAIELAPFRRDGVTVAAHYVMRKHVSGTTQFQDCCLAAGITEPVELRLDWPAATGPLIEQVLAPGKPVVCVQLPRAPMGREDGFGMELLPNGPTLQRLVDEVREVATVVQIGAGEPLYRLEGIDIDLANRTTVRELLDVASVASGFLGYCSFLLPLAESLDKPVLLAWSQRGLRSQNPFISSVTPRKLLHKPSSLWISDEPQDQRVRDTADEFRRLAGCR